MVFTRISRFSARLLQFKIYFRCPKFASMSSELQFTQIVNTVTGKMEWEAENRDEHDYFRDIARSSYADMLHDTERNKMYYKAIKLAIKEMHDTGRKAKVLDIGTGTGLLSMMAARAGADSITAIEVFDPMANVARSITKANGFGNIVVINSHSTEVSVGPESEMKEKANILVTELFDTELIGEGALIAYQHAHENLMEENSMAVPHSATIYVQLVESELITSWNTLSKLELKKENGTVRIIPDEKMGNSPGLPAVHDIQLSQVKENQFKKLTEPAEVFKFEWSSKGLNKKSRTSAIHLQAVDTGKVQVVLSWWTLNMDSQGEIILSTAPYWSHPAPKNMQWRDHWLQSVYFLPNILDVNCGDTLTLFSFHDVFTFWFETVKGVTAENKKPAAIRPICEYVPRMRWSRMRMGMLNDQRRNEILLKALNNGKYGHWNRHLALCVGDMSLLPLMVVQTCFKKGLVISVEPDLIAQRGLLAIIERNKLGDGITLVKQFPIPEDDKRISLKNRKIQLFVSEPYFSASILPWHDLRFWYLRTEFKDYLAPDAQIMPCRGHLCAAAAQFDHLWKIRAPVGTVEDFDLSVMDEMITNAMEKREYHEAEPHSLWEYPCKLLSEPTKLMTFDFEQCVPEVDFAASGYITITDLKERNDRMDLKYCHAIVLWMEYDLDEINTLSTGLLNRDMETPTWCMHRKQAVFFLRKDMLLDQNKRQKINFEVSFIPQSGEIKMKFREFLESE